MSGDSYWRGRKAVITGGSAGLGLELGQALAAAGAEVLLVARDQARLQQAAADLGGAECLAADICRDEDVERVAQWVRQRWHDADAWFNCAGRSSRGQAATTALDEYRELWELNFLATVRCSQAALPLLQPTGGHLVNIGSLASKFGSRHLGAYPASKFPVAAFSQQLRLELRDSGVHVLLVCPGPIRREDAGRRYAASAAGLPAEAARPGGGARLKGLDPQWLARRILRCCRQRRPELVAPARARLLAAISQLAPAWGDWLLTRFSS
jgi:short-subunit dehydrogenase